MSYEVYMECGKCYEVTNAKLWEADPKSLMKGCRPISYFKEICPECGTSQPCSGNDPEKYPFMFTTIVD